MTSPEQLPPVQLPEGTRQRMRARLLAEIADSDRRTRSGWTGWLAPTAVAASVLLAAGGVAVYRTSVDPGPPPGAAGTRTNASPPATASPDASSGGSVDCGTFRLSQGESLPASAVDCFLTAVRAGRPARLTVTRPTIEGDPISIAYTADGQGSVEVVTDSRQDKFGAQEIHRQLCTGLTIAGDGLGFARCSTPTVIG